MPHLRVALCKSQSCALPSPDSRVLTLAVEDITPDPFAHGHAKVDIETYSCNTDASVILILRKEICIVMMMVV